MPRFDFDFTVNEAGEKEAVEKMKCLKILSDKLKLKELQLLTATVNNPVLFAQAKQKLGID